MSNKKKDPTKKAIFIVYQSHELKITEALDALVKYWGYGSFFCRRRERDAETYKKELRDFLDKSDLVIILLSHELQWSPYCHAEIGTAMLMQKPIIAVMIPPLKRNDINIIAPVLEGYWLEDAAEWQDASDNDFLTTLQQRISKKLEITITLPPDYDHSESLKRGLAVREAIAKVNQDYALTPPRVLLRVWPKPALETGSPCCKSIIFNIKKSLANNEPITRLAFVGVSLKFSLKLIKKALEEFANDGRICDPTRTRKKLEIELIHMDDQAPILHALHDYEHDINSIRENFHKDWRKENLNKWKAACRKAHIELSSYRLHRIDYIPPRVGILIDYDDENTNKDCIFYAGRCAFHEPGNGFRLFCGELEYYFYTNAEHDIEGRNAIQEFLYFLKIARVKKYNTGVVQTLESQEWTTRLQEYIKHYPEIPKITVISASLTRCLDFVVDALRKGIDVDIYVQRPKAAAAKFKADINTLDQRLTDRINQEHDCSSVGTASVFYYTFPSPYRAILIENACIAMQMYLRPMNATRTTGLTEGGPLPVIVPTCSAQFEKLKSKLIDHFLKTKGVDKTRRFHIKNGIKKIG